MKVLLLQLLISLGAVLALSGCASSDEDDAPKLYKPRAPRDPVEQRVFYDGWGRKNR